MKTIFDKIYVISLFINNKDRQEFIKKQFNELGLEFEFIYGIDYYNLRKNYIGEDIVYPKMHYYDTSNGKIFGSSVGHYFAILQAYHLGYENVLVIEDDICFIKDKSLIEYYLNNIPDDADFITWDPRVITQYDNNIIYDIINNSKQYYEVIGNHVASLIGAMMYGVMNRNSMKLYIDNQHNNFKCGDHVDGFFDNPIVKRYVSSKCICTDQHNIETNFNTKLFYECIYKKIDQSLSINSFYNPIKFNSFT